MTAQVISSDDFILSCTTSAADTHFSDLGYWTYWVFNFSLCLNALLKSRILYLIVLMTQICKEYILPVSTKFAWTSKEVGKYVQGPTIGRCSKLHTMSCFLQLCLQIFFLKTVKYLEVRKAYLKLRHDWEVWWLTLTIGEEGLWETITLGSLLCSILSCSWCNRAKPAAMSLGTRSVSCKA